MDQVSRALLVAGGANTTQVLFSQGTTNWTVPAGVTTLLSVSGKGQDGVSDASTPSTISAFDSDVGTATASNGSGGFFNFGTAYSEVQNYYSTYIASATQGTMVPRLRWVRYISTSNSQIDTIYGNPQQNNYGNIKFHSAVDTTPQPRGANNTPTSGQLTDYNTQYVTASYRGFGLNINYLPLGYAGANSTAFGLTFPGGTYSAPNGNAATLTTFTNVSVTPGQSYSIVNNNSGTPITVIY